MNKNRITVATRRAGRTAQNNTITCYLSWENIYMKNKAIYTLGLSSLALVASAGAAYAAGFAAPAMAGSGALLAAGSAAVLGMTGLGVCKCATGEVEDVADKAEDMGLYLRALDCNRYAEGLLGRATNDPEAAWAYVAPVWHRSRDSLEPQAYAVVADLAARFERRAA